MPLSSGTVNAALQPALKTQIMNVFQPLFIPNTDPTAIEGFINDLATAISQAVSTVIVAQIQSNAEVNVGIPVTTSGTATNQTGATIAPGTIS
jgi:hypothetical protein